MLFANWLSALRNRQSRRLSGTRRRKSSKEIPLSSKIEALQARTMLSGDPITATPTDVDETVGSVDIDVTIPASLLTGIDPNFASLSISTLDDGSATEGLDFGMSYQYVDIYGYSGGDVTATITVPIMDDTEPDEAGEYFLIEVVEQTFYESIGTVAITINDDEAPSGFSVVLTDSWFAEPGDTPPVGTPYSPLMVVANGTLTSPLTVNLGIQSGGTADSPDDFTLTTTSVVLDSSNPSATIGIDIADDEIPDSGETFSIEVLSISGGGTGSVMDPVGTATIYDDESDVTIDIHDATFTEGDASPTGFQVSASGLITSPITVNYSASHLTTTASDFTLADGSVTLTAAAPDAWIVPTITSGDGDEPDEQFQVELTSTTSGTLGDTTAIGTIVDADDPVPFELSITDGYFLEEGDDPTSKPPWILMTVIATGTLPGPVTVNLAATDGTATVADYHLASTSVILDAANPSAIVDVTTFPDDLPDDLETFEVQITSFSGGSGVVIDDTALGTIFDDDATVETLIRVDDAEYMEGEVDPAPIYITATGDLSIPVTVNYDVTPVTAVYGIDYTLDSGSVVLTDATPFVGLVPQIHDPDNDFNDPRKFEVTITGVSHGTIEADTGLATIIDDDSTSSELVVNIDDGVFPEDPSGGETRGFRIWHSGSLTGNLIVDLESADGAASGGGVDFDFPPQQVILSPSSPEAIVYPWINPDGIEEGLEDFIVSIVSVNSVFGTATISDGVATGEIIDSGGGSGADDVTVEIADTTFTEGDGTSQSFLVTFSGVAPAADFPLSYVVVDESATNGDDYILSDGTVTVHTDLRDEFITPDIPDVDMDPESPRTFRVEWVPTAGVHLARPTGLGTIVDDDGAAGELSVVISDATFSELSGGTGFEVTAHGTGSATLYYSASDGTATAGDDYDLPAGAFHISAGETVYVDPFIYPDTVSPEPDETFQVTFSSFDPVVYSRGTPVATGTIQDGGRETGDVTVGIYDAVFTEGEGTSGTGFRVESRGLAPTTPIEVDYLVYDESATSPTDYVLASGSVEIFPDLRDVFVVPDIPDVDSAANPSRTFRVELQPATGVSFSDATATGTIHDDDDVTGLTVSISDQSFNEAEGFGSGFTVTAMGAGSTTVTYTVFDESATSGEDYQLTSGTIDIDAGTTQSIYPYIIDDFEDDDGETFRVELSTTDPAVSFAQQVATGTIIDSGRRPINPWAPSRITVEDAEFTEGGPQSTGFRVSVSYGSVPREIEIPYWFSSGSATVSTTPENADVLGHVGTVTLTPSEPVQFVNPQILSDNTAEPDEDFFIQLFSRFGPSRPGTRARGVIVDDDQDPAGPVVSITGAAFTEDVENPSSGFVISATGDLSTPVEVTVQTRVPGDSAINDGIDYLFATTSVTLTQSNPSAELIPIIIDDARQENDETFTVRIDSLSHGSIAGTGSAQGTITDNDSPGDPAPQVAIADAEFTEGVTPTSGFLVTGTGISTDVTIDYTVTSRTATVGTAADPGIDVVLADGSFTLSPSSSTYSIIPSEIPLDALEGPETFVVELTTRDRVDFTDHAAVGVITDGTPPEPEPDGPRILAVEDEFQSKFVRAEYSIGQHQASERTRDGELVASEAREIIELAMTVARDAELTEQSATASIQASDGTAGQGGSGHLEVTGQSSLAGVWSATPHIHVTSRTVTDDKISVEARFDLEIGYEADPTQSQAVPMLADAIAASIDSVYRSAWESAVGGGFSGIQVDALMRGMTIALGEGGEWFARMADRHHDMTEPFSFDGIFRFAAKTEQGDHVVVVLEEDASPTDLAVIAPGSQSTDVAFTSATSAPTEVGTPLDDVTSQLLAGIAGTHITLEADQSGSESYSVSALDGSDILETASVTVIVNAVNDAPVITSPSFPNPTITYVVIDEGVESDPIAFSVSDIDGDNLTVSVTTSDETLLPVTGIVVEGEGASRTVKITPGFVESNTNGIVTLTVSDGRLTDSGQIHVTVRANADPVAQPDEVTVVTGTSITIDALANDTDAETDELRYVSFTHPQSTAEGFTAPGFNDPNDDTGEFAWLREALSESPISLRTRTGTAFVESLEGGAQSLIYIPHEGAFGQDSFDYTISDRFGQTSTATVTVNVTPLRSVELTVDTGEDDDSTNDPRITAVVDGVGSNSQVTFEVDRDFDGVADESALAIFTTGGLADASGDGMAAVTLNPFGSTPPGHGSHSFQYRVTADSPLTAASFSSDWKSGSVSLVAPVASAILTLDPVGQEMPDPDPSVEEVEEPEDPNASPNRLVGVLDGEGDDVSFVAIDYLITQGGTTVDSGTTFSDKDGRFTIDPRGALTGTYTVTANAVVQDLAAGGTFSGPSKVSQFTAVEAEIVDFTSFELTDDEDDDGKTSLPEIRGQLKNGATGPTTYTAGSTEESGGEDPEDPPEDPETSETENDEDAPSLAFVTIEFDHNNDGTVDGTAITDWSGEFTYYAGEGLSVGPQSIKARTARWDAARRATIYSDWSTFEFELLASDLPTLTLTGGAFELLEDTGTDSADGITTSATVTGTFDEGEAAAGVLIEFSHLPTGDAVDGVAVTDHTGRFTYVPIGLAVGAQTLRMRTRRWNPATQTLETGSWTSLSLTLQAAVDPTPVLIWDDPNAAPPAEGSEDPPPNPDLDPSDDTAATTFNDAVNTAATLRDTAITDSLNSLQTTLDAIQSTYDGSIAAADAALTTALASFGGDTSTLDFEGFGFLDIPAELDWDETPEHVPYAGLDAIPEANTPLHDFDVDDSFRVAAENAQTQYTVDLEQAHTDFLGTRKDKVKAYQQALADAANDRESAVKAAENAKQQLLDTYDDQLVNSWIAAIESLAASNATGTLTDIAGHEYEVLDLEAYDTGTYGEGWPGLLSADYRAQFDLAAATMYSTIAGGGDVSAAEQAYDLAVATITYNMIEEHADELRDVRNDLVDDQGELQKRRNDADRNRAHAHAQDAWSKRDIEIRAEEAYGNSVADADKVYADAVADAVHQLRIDLVTAENTRREDQVTAQITLSNSRMTATETALGTWRTANPGPLADREWDIFQAQKTHVNDLNTRMSTWVTNGNTQLLTTVTNIADADRTEAKNNATSQKTYDRLKATEAAKKDKAFNDAEKTRAKAVADKEKDKRDGFVTARVQLLQDENDAQYDKTEAIAAAQKTLDEAIANKWAAQPDDFRYTHQLINPLTGDVYRTIAASPADTIDITAEQATFDGTHQTAIDAREHARIENLAKWAGNDWTVAGGDAGSLLMTGRLHYIQTFQNAVADKRYDEAETKANAQRDHDKAVATDHKRHQEEIATNGNTAYKTGVTEFENLQTWDNNEQAELAKFQSEKDGILSLKLDGASEKYRIAIADDYRGYLDDWDAGRSTPFTTYMKSVASAQHSFFSTTVSQFGHTSSNATTAGKFTSTIASLTDTTAAIRRTEAQAVADYDNTATVSDTQKGRLNDAVTEDGTRADSLADASKDRLFSLADADKTHTHAVADANHTAALAKALVEKTLLLGQAAALRTMQNDLDVAQWTYQLDVYNIPDDATTQEATDAWLAAGQTRDGSWINARAVYAKASADLLETSINGRTGADSTRDTAVRPADTARSTAYGQTEHDYLEAIADAEHDYGVNSANDDEAYENDLATHYENLQDNLRGISVEMENTVAPADSSHSGTLRTHLNTYQQAVADNRVTTLQSWRTANSGTTGADGNTLHAELADYYVNMATHDQSWTSGIITQRNAYYSAISPYQATLRTGLQTADGALRTTSRVENLNLTGDIASWRRSSRVLAAGHNRDHVDSLADKLQTRTFDTAEDRADHRQGISNWHQTTQDAYADARNTFTHGIATAFQNNATSTGDGGGASIQVPLNFSTTTDPISSVASTAQSTALTSRFNGIHQDIRGLVGSVGTAAQTHITDFNTLENDLVTDLTGLAPLATTHETEFTTNQGTARVTHAEARATAWRDFTSDQNTDWLVYSNGLQNAVQARRNSRAEAFTDYQVARALREKNAETPGTDEYVIASGQHVWATTIKPEYEAYVSALESAETIYSSTITASRNTAALADANASITREGDIARAQKDRSLADVAATQADRDTSRTIQTDFLLGGGGITSQLSNDGSFRLNVAADTKANALLIADAGQSVQSEIEPSASGSTTEDPNNSESGPDFQASYDTHFAPLQAQLETDIETRTTAWRTSTAASVESRTIRELNLSRDAQNAAAQRRKTHAEASADADQAYRLAQLAEDVRHMGVVRDAEWTRSVTRANAEAEYRDQLLRAGVDAWNEVDTQLATPWSGFKANEAAIRRSAFPQHVLNPDPNDLTIAALPSGSVATTVTSGTLTYETTATEAANAEWRFQSSLIPAYQTMMTSIIAADRSQVDDQNSRDASSTLLVAQQYHTSGTDIAASVEAVHVSGDQAAWKGEWATKVNSHSSALNDLERDRIEDSADDHIARSDERATAVRTYSLAHNAERKTRDDAVDEFWSDFALEHATLLDSVAAGSSNTTPWQDHLEAEADATLTKITDEKTPRENHGETISLNEKIYADELAARRFDLQHDRNVQSKADALAEHDDRVTEQEDLTADDGYELQKLEYTAAPFEPTLDAESDLSGWETGLQSDRHWAIQGYERHPGFVPVELMEQALTAGTQDEYGDFDFTTAAWDADDITPNRYFFQLNPTAHLSEAIDQHTWAQNSGANDDPWWQYSALATGNFSRTSIGTTASDFSGFARFGDINGSPPTGNRVVPRYGNGEPVDLDPQSKIEGPRPDRLGPSSTHKLRPAFKKPKSTSQQRATRGSQAVLAVFVDVASPPIPYTAEGFQEELVARELEQLEQTLDEISVARRVAKDKWTKNYGDAAEHFDRVEELRENPANSDGTNRDKLIEKFIRLRDVEAALEMRIESLHGREYQPLWVKSGLKLLRRQKVVKAEDVVAVTVDEYMSEARRYLNFLQSHGWQVELADGTKTTVDYDQKLIRLATYRRIAVDASGNDWGMAEITYGNRQLTNAEAAKRLMTSLRQLFLEDETFAGHLAKWLSSRGGAAADMAIGAGQVTVGIVMMANGGVLTFFSAGLMSPVTISMVVAGGGVTGLGADRISTGYGNWLSGKNAPTQFSRALDTIGVDPYLRDVLEFDLMIAEGLGGVAAPPSRISNNTLRSADGYINEFVDGVVSKELLDQIRFVARHHKSLQREGFGGLRWIDTGASVSKYVDTEHGILLDAVEGSVPRGLLAEELQHAIEVASGYHTAQRIAAVRRIHKGASNDVWHQGVFNRIADSLENDNTSIFLFFLSPEDAVLFRRAAAGLPR